MATASLVNLHSDLGALVLASLDAHRVPISASYDVLEKESGEQYFAFSTPLVAKKGKRDAYLEIFSALESESFLSQASFRLHTLLLSQEESKQVDLALQDGITEANLPSLGRLGEVIVRPICNPMSVEKAGFLIVSRLPSGQLQMSFNPFDSHLSKPRQLVNLDELKDTLGALNILSPKIITDLEQANFAATPMKASLATLYQQGLI